MGTSTIQILHFGISPGVKLDPDFFFLHSRAIVHQEVAFCSCLLAPRHLGSDVVELYISSSTVY